MKFLQIFWIIVISFAICACGGGGGSSTNCEDGTVASSWTYQTVWELSDSNQSQVISLYTLAGSNIATRVLNRGTNSINVSLNSGTYRIVASQYTGTNGTGTLTGQIETKIAICGTSNFSSRSSGSVSQVLTVPTTFTIIQNSSQKCFGATVDSSGNYLFSRPGTISFTVLGSIGTVDTTGNFIALTAANGSIRVSHSDSGLSSSIPVTVNPFVATRSKWTVLVYMNAANDLHPFSTLNVNQMEKVANNSQVRFVVQWKQSQTAFPSSSFDGTRRLLAKFDTSNSIASQTVQDMGGGVDMGDWQTLQNFIIWGKQNYPADRYVLVVWNHGNGWSRRPNQTRAVSYDDETGNAIQIWELPSALASQTFDIFAWDASLMQMIEVAYEIRNHATLIAGSEESPPGEGYPYDAVFGGFRDDPDNTVANLSKGFVDGMVNNPPYASRKITQSVLKSNQLSALATAIDTFAGQLIANRSSLTTITPNIRTNAQTYSQTTLRTYRDLKHLCELYIVNGGTPNSVKIAAQGVIDAIDNSILWEGHNSNSANSKGIAIDFSSGATFPSLSGDYSQMKFAADTRWNEWLQIAP